MPLISVVIAFVPQSSAETLIALNDAGILSMKVVGESEEPEANKTEGIDYAGENYKLFVDAIGQPQLAFEDIPFPGLREGHTISPARLKFRDSDIGREARESGERRVRQLPDGNYYLTVPGMAINDHFQPLDSYNALNERIYVMAVPYIGGYNPDYSGLDFGEAASSLIAEALLKTI